MEAPAGEEHRCLGVSKINIHGTPLHALMDSRAFPNVVSSKVVKELGVTPEWFDRVVTVAKGWRAGVLGKLNYVPVDLRGAIVKMEFVVLANLPFDVFIGRSKIDRLDCVLDFQRSEVRLQ